MAVINHNLRVEVALLLQISGLAAAITVVIEDYRAAGAFAFGCLTRLCLFSVPDCVKETPQTLHVKGFLPVWRLWCTMKFELLLKTLLQPVNLQT